MIKDLHQMSIVSLQSKSASLC